MHLPHLLGNERLKAALSRLPASGLGSAILLDGPGGSGKRTAALDIALGLFCQAADKPCLRCPSCRRVLAGSHPDLQRLAYEGKAVKVDAVRALRSQSFIKPSESAFKIFLIEQADRLNVQSQNALLKVLEEPSSSVFILLCENREAMLQTVRSRCKPFRLAPLELPVLERALRERCPEAAAEAIAEAAAHSDGILGKALGLLQGEDEKSHLCAAAFTRALPQGELAVFEACQALSRLTREEYMEFCDEACRLLCAAAKRSGSWREISVFEYLEQQRAMLAQNPSLSALSGALAAFCARC